MLILLIPHLVRNFFLNMVRNHINIQKHATLLHNNIISLLRKNDFSSLETNYLAVTFEALSSLYPLINKNKIETINYIFYLFYQLQQRISIDGLYLFSDMKNARVDITGHVFNGYFDILSQNINWFYI